MTRLLTIPVLLALAGPLAAADFPPADFQGTVARDVNPGRASQIVVRAGSMVYHVAELKPDTIVYVVTGEDDRHQRYTRVIDPGRVKRGWLAKVWVRHNGDAWLIMVREE